MKTAAAASVAHVNRMARVQPLQTAPPEATVRKASASLHHRVAPTATAALTDSFARMGIAPIHHHAARTIPAPEGQVCATNYDPPACLPEGAGQCSRDEQCPADQYCDLFSATCAPGCRQGNCPAGQFCNQQHVCVDGNGSAIGDACSDNNQCPGGTTCAYNDPSAGLTCDLLPIGDCSKSCKQVCDLATSIIIDTCPQGEACGGDSATQALINQLFGSLLGSETASVCYPSSNP